jgi:hypothetical protein
MVEVAGIAKAYFRVASTNGLLPGKKLEIGLKALNVAGQHVALFLSS